MEHSWSSDAVALITALVPLVGAIFSGLAMLYAARARNGMVGIKSDMIELAANTNSIKDELVKTTGNAQFAAGHLAGRADQKADDANGKH